MVAADCSAANSIEGLGISLRGRGSAASIKPASRNSPVSPSRQEIPSVGSAIENTTVQPPLWREKEAIGALTESLVVIGLFAGVNAASCCAGSAGLAATAGCGSDAPAVPLRK